MSVTGTPAADGTVFIKCPNCQKDLRVRPRSSRTTVPCAACGQKFVLETAGLPPASGTVPVPPPVPAQQAKPSMVAAPPPPASPTPRPKREATDFFNDDRPPPRRKPAKSAGAPVGLLIGGGVAVLLLIVGGVVGVIYALRADTPAPGPTGPVAAAPVSQVGVTEPPPPPVEPVPPEIKVVQTPTTTPSPRPLPPRSKSKTPSTTPTDPAPNPEEPGSTVAVPTGAPAKTNPPKAPPPAGVAGMDAIERVKMSTALIEHKMGHGSGFVIRPGIVMTNHHVIAGVELSDIRVSFVSADDTAPAPLKPTLLYDDPRRDLAIFRVDTDRSPLEIAERGTELTGLDVAVVGNPRDVVAGQAQINKVTTGSLVAPIRRDAGWTFYELRAEALPGNSGGPVVDRKSGKLVGVLQSGVMEAKVTKTYCIPFGEVVRALDTLPEKREDEAKATRIALARHYLDYVDEHLKEMENNAEIAMEGQLNRLLAKSLNANVTVTVTRNGIVTTYALGEFMDMLRDKHKKTYPIFTKVVSPAVKASSEVPSPLKQALQVRVDSYLSMYSLADQSTRTEKAFRDAMESRKVANAKAAKNFNELTDKFFDELERNPAVKAK